MRQLLISICCAVLLCLPSYADSMTGGGGTGTGGEVMPVANFSAPGTAIFGMNFVDATAGAIAITIPTAVSNSGHIVEVKKIDTTNHVISFIMSGGQTVDTVSAANFSLTQSLQELSIISSGANFFVK